jgi:hypothetical protein
MKEEKVKELLEVALKKGVELGVVYQSTPKNLKPFVKDTISEKALNWIAEQIVNENK